MGTKGKGGLQTVASIEGRQITNIHREAVSELFGFRFQRPGLSKADIYALLKLDVRGTVGHPPNRRR